MRDEQQRQSTTTAVQEAATTSACPHAEAVGKRWGDPISEDRQAELQTYLDTWKQETDHGERKSPFDQGVLATPLTGADVYWLAEQLRDPTGCWNLNLDGAELSHTHLEGAHLLGARLAAVRLKGAYLEGSTLASCHLEGAHLGDAHLEHAILAQAELESALLGEAHLEDANLDSVQLRDASLDATHLERAHLWRAQLTNARLSQARLEDAFLLEANLANTDLTLAHLEGADLSLASLEGANLRGAWLDSRTILTMTRLDARTFLGDIRWNGVGAVDLTGIDWEAVPRLGDELSLLAAMAFLTRSARRIRGDDAYRYEAVARAYRQIAAQLRAQGVSEAADRFAYRAQVYQRTVLRSRFRIPQYLGSWLLDLISGYGYRPMRSFITYALVVLGFAATYFALGGSNGHPLSWNEAIVVSMTAFHGRGFFAAVFQASDPQAAVAAVEAFIGLLIEIVFIATFTQRLFAR